MLDRPAPAARIRHAADAHRRVDPDHADRIDRKAGHGKTTGGGADDDRLSLREATRRSGLSFQHLIAVERGAKRLYQSGCRDLAQVLSLPSEWLRHGWSAASDSTT
jgi:hypothetical protein